MHPLVSQLVVVVVASAMVLSCAPGTTNVQAGATSVYVGVEGEDGESELLDETSLFARAGKLYDRGRYLRALELYEILLAEFSDSSLRTAVLYDAALCLKALRRHDEAIVMFARYLDMGPGTRGSHDALFQTASSHEALERWGEAEGLYRRLLSEPLEAAEQLVAKARLGRALLATERYEEAEDQFRSALYLQKHHEQLKMMRGSRPAALAAFGLGEVYRHRVDGVVLRLPVERMAQDLEEKSQFFLRAQDRYLDALRFQDRTWSLAAGLRIGMLYEGFRDSLAAAERSDELATPEQHAAYEAVLREKLAPLVEKARIAYEMTLEMSARMGAQDSEWSKETKKSLERLRRLAAPGS